MATIPVQSKGSSIRANVLVSANDPEVIVKLKITLRQGKIRLARIRTFGHLENASVWPLQCEMRGNISSFCSCQLSRSSFACI